jgi:PAS domain S-box-containing protein
MILNNEILAGLIDGSPYPIYLILGEELIVAVANAATLKAWDKDKSVIGKPFAEALPELEGQPFEGLLRKVMLTGEPYYAVNDPAKLLVDGQLKTFYFTFSYQPVVGNDGRNIGVCCYATDVTGLVNSAEELAAANRELTASYHLLELTELRFRNLIMQAPFSICVIRAKDLVVTDVNSRYLILVGKTREQMDQKSIWKGVPEAAEIYAPLMQEVIETGKTYSAKEAEIFLLRNGLREQVFIDFTYEPVFDLEGKVTSIMVVGIDVSEKVNNRKAIEEVEERMRLAIDAADIGTYEYRFDSDSFVASKRCSKLLQLNQNGSRKELLKHFHPDDKKLSEQALLEAKHTGKVFYEARLVHPDQPVRWLRFQAKVYFDLNGAPERSLGTVIDITQHKALQQQKDDFISIASHELKTPITSLKASLQLLTRMKEQPNSNLFPKLLDRATRSMDKISSLVEDLLNVSKMNHGQIGLDKELFNVMDMLKKSCEHLLDSAKHELVFEGDADLILFADEHRIEQVVVNLLTNAIKYAPKSYQIFLKVEKVNDTVVVSVRDTGPGVEPDKVANLFDRYYRADNSGKQVSGLGLGLYISAEIIERHGGKIGVNTELGKGSTFWFSLPLLNLVEKEKTGHT